MSPSGIEGFADSAWGMVVSGEEDEQEKGEDVGQGEEEIGDFAGEAEGEGKLVAAGFCQAEEQADRQGGQNFPVAEDKGGDGEIAVSHVDAGGEVGGGGIGEEDTCQAG